MPPPRRKNSGCVDRHLASLGISLSRWSSSSSHERRRLVRDAFRQKLQFHPDKTRRAVPGFDADRLKDARDYLMDRATNQDPPDADAAPPAFNAYVLAMRVVMRVGTTDGRWQ